MASTDADRSEDWRAPPPHIPLVSAASTQYASARTQPGNPGASVSASRPTSPSAATNAQGGAPQDGAPSPIPSGSPAPRTASPFAPTGLTARVVSDGKGGHFLVQLETGLRIDVIDDESIPTPEDLASVSVRKPAGPSESGPTLSEESDITDTRGSTEVNTRSSSHHGVENKIAALLAEVGPDALSREQKAVVNQLRGSLTTGRDRLFTTTAMVLDNQQEIRLSHEELMNFRDEVANRLAEMHRTIRGRHDQLDNCVSENVKVLRDLGVSEALLGDILKNAAKTRSHELRRPELPTYEIPDSTAVDDESLAGINAALAPRRAGESLEEFGRRAEATLARKNRMAASFAPTTTNVADSIKAPIPPPKPVTRFEDVGSISSAPRRPRFSTLSSNRPVAQGGNSLSHTGFLTADDSSDQPGDIFEEFRRETEEAIARIIEKHLSEVLNVPARVKPPKLDTPPKYSGLDDHLKFMRWVEKLASWMRAMFYGGTEDDVDSYRLSVLKNLLDGVALEWYMDFVDNPANRSEHPDLDFTGVLCELHHRFITTATAHHALREFDLIRFKPEAGPLQLLDDLETCSRRMREPLPDVIIRQRFMKLIPPDLHDDLTALRGISASYSSIAQMRTHAYSLWDALKTARGGGRMRSSTSMTKTDSGPRAAGNSRKVTTSAETRPRTATQPAPSKPPQARHSPQGPHADKTCYKCGIVGHIGSDPECPKYNEPAAPRDRPRVGAQWVRESYVAEDEELDLDAEADPVHDNWGGSQYDSEPEDGPVERTADLQELVNETEEEVRMGTTRLQYFSSRIAAPLAEEAEEAPRPSAASLLAALPSNLRPIGGFGPTALSDFLRINTFRASRGLPIFRGDDEERLIQELRSTHRYRDDPEDNFAALLAAYEDRHGDVDWTPAAVDESEALFRLQLAEDIRDMRNAISLAPLAFTPEFSPDELALMSVDQLAELMTSYVQGTEAVAGVRRGLFNVNRMGREAMQSLNAQRSTPRGSESPTSHILDVTEDMLWSTLEYTTQFLRAADRRLEDRRIYTVRLRYEHSVRPALFPLLVGPVEDPNSVPSFETSESDDELAAHDEEQIRSMLSSPSFLTSGTPPPSYPGTPENDASAMVIDISSDEESWGGSPEPESSTQGRQLGLRAIRMDTPDSEDDMPPLTSSSPFDGAILSDQGNRARPDEAPTLEAVTGGFGGHHRPSAQGIDEASRMAEWAHNSQTMRVGGREVIDMRDWTPPENPDEPTDERRLWIRGLNYDYSGAHVLA
ncbi:hypothetical protein DFH06DRAFT_1154129 [Mycena polygramma]|nr:hypothetical protein DFH06DRAFT_1154129 [Mycena polygramma]